MRRVLSPLATLAVALMVLIAAFVPTAAAQDVDEVIRELEQNGYYIERGAEGSDARFRQLVQQGDATGETWYFVSLDGSVSGSYADDLFESLTPQGPVLLYFLDNEGFANVQFATDESVSSSTQRQALQAFDDDWDQPEDFMEEVVQDYTSLTGSSTGSAGSGSSGSSDSSSSSNDSSGGGFPWGWVLVPAVLVGGFWFVSRRGSKKREGEDLETAQKIRAELQAEIDELANDVLVLSGPVDVADKDQITTYYREATDTYLDISEELPDVDQLKEANLKELSELGARVAHARWQMDAAEALISGEPVPEKPKVEPPPPKPSATPRAERPRARQMPQRQPRPRVPYSRSRRRSGGGLLDILIAGAGMMGGRSRGGGMFGGTRGRSGGGGMFGGSSRSGGGMFGGGSSNRSSRSRTTRNQPRPGGGVFGRSSGSSSGRSTRSTRSSSSRRPRSSGRKSRSTSRRRRR